MTIRIFRDAREAAAKLADRIAARLSEEPALVLGLPAGRTPVELYRQLVARFDRAALDFSQATTFNLDEFLGIGPEHPGSYRAFMDRHLFQHINLRDSRINFLNGLTSNPEEECVRYEDAITRAGGIGLQILGIGTNGHIGFNEPGRTLAVRTHRVTLRAETRRANAALFDGDPERVPCEALSMGVATILHARAIVLLATGRSKAKCVAQMIDSDLTTELPASFLQVHCHVEVFLDEAAASGLRTEERRTKNGEEER